MKGKCAIKIFDKHFKLKKRYWGRHFWAKGYCVSTIDLNEEEIRKYVRWQLEKDKRISTQNLGFDPGLFSQGYSLMSQEQIWPLFRSTSNFKLFYNQRISLFRNITAFCFTISRTVVYDPVRKVVWEGLSAMSVPIPIGQQISDNVNS